MEGTAAGWNLELWDLFGIWVLQFGNFLGLRGFAFFVTTLCRAPSKEMLAL
jgi:hypothetical protein